MREVIDMKLEEVEEQLSNIYNIAASTQGSVRVLIVGKVEGVELSKDQLETMKKAAKANIKTIKKIVNELRKW